MKNVLVLFFLLSSCVSKNDLLLGEWRLLGGSTDTTSYTYTPNKSWDFKAHSVDINDSLGVYSCEWTLNEGEDTILLSCNKNIKAYKIIKLDKTALFLSSHKQCLFLTKYP